MSDPMSRNDDAEIIVIGNGLFGSAITRHLADAGRSVLTIGSANYDPAQPIGDGDPNRVYNSHNDAARLTRRASRDPRWNEVTRRAVSQYSVIEDRSGIRFHEPVGVLLAGGGDANLDALRASLQAEEVDHEVFRPADRTWRERWPAVYFPDDQWVVFEPAPAGYIRPLDLIAAQNAIATASGATFAVGVAIKIERNPSGWRVHTTNGESYVATTVVVAAGAFSALHDLVPGGVELELKSEVIALGTVSEIDGQRLAQVPTVHWANEPRAIDDIYMVGPVRYPDGTWKIKIGANTALDKWFAPDPSSLASVQAWFATDTDADYEPLFAPYLRQLWPEVDFVSITTRPCIITYTPERMPLIAEPSPGLFVATAGNGSGAKTSDGWGERAAALVTSARS